MKKRVGRGARIRAGGFSALLVLLVLTTLTALNIAAQALEKKNGWKVDLSFNAIATQSPETVRILAELDTPVKIWALFQRGREDAPLLELLDRYAAGSSMLTWEQEDPSLNPALVNRFTTDARTPVGDDLIVFCEKTGRFRVLGPEDYISLTMDEETGEYSYAGWTYEQSITRAIQYVTRERIPKAVIVQGHGELDGEKTEAFRELLIANQYEVTQENLADADYVPDPADLLIFFSPLRDLDDQETEKLTTFAALGGSFLFTCDYTDKISEMPRYASLLRSYGLLPLEGVVVADRDAANTYYNGNRLWLLPEMCPTDLTSDLLASGASHLLLTGARAFEDVDEGDRNLMVATVLRSGETAYLKQITAGMTNMERGEGDPQAAFPLALQATRVTTEGYISRAFIIGSSAALTEKQLYAMTDAQQLIIRVMEFLLHVDASDLNIMAKTAIRPALSVESAPLGSVILVALPALTLAAALLVLGARRR